MTLLNTRATSNAHEHLQVATFEMLSENLDPAIRTIGFSNVELSISCSAKEPLA